MKFLLVIMHGFHIKESKVQKPGTRRSEPTLAAGYMGGREAAFQPQTRFLKGGLASSSVTRLFLPNGTKPYIIIARKFSLSLGGSKASEFFMPVMDPTFTQ